MLSARRSSWRMEIPWAWQGQRAPVTTNLLFFVGYTGYMGYTPCKSLIFISFSRNPFL